MESPPLALLLLRASRWFDRELLAGLQRQGWPALTPTQSLVFAHLDRDGVSPSELARRLGTSRQATSDLLTGLVRLELLALQPNPARRGGKLVVLTTRGQALTRDALRLLHGLEVLLGPAECTELRRLLNPFMDPAGPPTRNSGSRARVE